MTLSTVPLAVKCCFFPDVALYCGIKKKTTFGIDRPVVSCVICLYGYCIGTRVLYCLFVTK